MCCGEAISSIAEALRWRAVGRCASQQETLQKLSLTRPELQVETEQRQYFVAIAIGFRHIEQTANASGMASSVLVGPSEFKRVHRPEICDHRRGLLACKVVRLWSFVLLEVAAVAGVAAGVVIGARHFRAGIASASARTLGQTMVTPLEANPLEPQPVVVARSAAGTFLGIKDELLLERMRSAEVVRAKLNKGGSSISFRLDFADGSHAAFKPEQINPQTVPRKEIAAYRLNRMLGMNAVPPATHRTLHRDDLVGKLPPDAAFLAARINAETSFDDEGFVRGEVSYWVPVIVDSHLDTLDSVLNWWRWMTIGEQIPPDKVELMQQFSSLLLFDLLTNNSDRFSGGNLMTSPDGKTLFWMDNTFGFQVEPEGHVRCRTYLSRCQKFSRKMVAALRKMDLSSLRRALEPEPGVLTEAEMGAVLARRDVALKYVDGLIAQFGAERVLVFP